MSKAKPAEFKCPYCHKKINPIIWESINTKDDPHMAAKVRDGSAFLYKCPKCKKTTSLQYDFLYHQPDDKLMIYFAPSEDGARQVRDMYNDQESEPVKMIKEKEYAVRMVRTMPEFLEKLAIFDLGFDDRVIELGKSVYRKQFAEMPGMENVDRVEFRATGEDEYRFIFYNNTKAVLQAAFPADMYEQILLNYMGRLIRDLSPEINSTWADNFIAAGTVKS